MGIGYIKLFRQFQSHWIWKLKEPFDKRSAWLDLLMTANHKNTKILFEGSLIEIERGQLLTSKRKLSEKWMWNRRTVDKYLALLEQDGMVTTKCTTKCTIITIVNYGNYQRFSEKNDDEDAPQNEPQNTPRYAPRCSTNNNVNNELKSSNSFYAKEKSSSDMISERSYSAFLHNVVMIWIQYNREKKRPLHPTALTVLLDKIDTELKTHTEQEIADVINLSIQANYQGIAWEKMNKQKKQSSWDYIESDQRKQQRDEFLEDFQRHLLGG